MASNDNRHVIAVSDPAALAKAAAERLMARIAANRGRVAICLTGGSSPKQLYQLLATDAYRSRIPWDRVHWFIGDERFVAGGRSPQQHGDGAADLSGSLARRLPTSTRFRPTLPIPTRAARRYERELKSFYGADELDPARPLFDLVLMGVGPDGHTASLFPGYPAIDETERWVVGVPKAHVEPFVPRVTLTLPALGSCREMLFEVAGSEKRAILTRVLAGENLPANRARSIGETIWLVDQAALPENFRGR